MALPKGKIPESRRFGGKRYQWYNSYKDKPSAKQRAKALRREGYSVRIIYHKRRKRFMPWALYTHKSNR